MSVAIVTLAEQRGFSMDDRGIVLGAFFPGYVLTQVLGAELARHFGGRRVLFAIVTAWSTLTLITPSCSGTTATLVGCRFVLGLAEGMAEPAIYHIVAASVPKDRRGISISALACGNQIGALLAFLTCPFMIKWWGWPSVFYLFGGLGYLWCVVWGFMTFREGNDVHHVDEAPPDDTQMLVQGRPETTKTSMADSFRNARAMLNSPPCLVIFLCHFALGCAHFVALSWMPTYYSEKFQIEAESVWIAMVRFHFVSAIPTTCLDLTAIR
jgi:ACS family sodium-dependent inorganic phosphate cotransporter